MRKQKGQVIDAGRSFLLRYYINAEKDGKLVRIQKCVKLSEKSDQYRFPADVQPLVDQHLKAVNANSAPITGSMALSEYVETQYMP
jgi:hypothetical protein